VSAARRAIAVGCAFLTLLAAPAQAGGVLVVQSRTTEAGQVAENQILDGFREVYHGAVEVVDERREFAKKVAREQPQLVVALGREAASAARDRNLPLLFLMVRNPAAARLTGPSIAGISLDIPGAAQVAYFKELVPTLRTMGVIYPPDDAQTTIQEAQGAAKQLGVRLLAVPADSKREAQTAFTLVGEIVDALWIIPDNNMEELVKSLLAARDHRLPVFIASEGLIKKGALAGLILDYRQIGRECGDLVERLLAGKTTLAQIGIRPPVVQRALNRTTAKALGLAVPPNLQQTAKIFE
jgi:putative tryptophan/tyrosine transport system substrate-binding protein